MLGSRSFVFDAGGGGEHTQAGCTAVASTLIYLRPEAPHDYHLRPPHRLRPGDVVLLPVQHEVRGHELPPSPLGDEIPQGVPGQVLKDQEGLEVVLDAAPPAADEADDVAVSQASQVRLLDVELPLYLLQGLVARACTQHSTQGLFLSSSRAIFFFGAVKGERRL